MYLHCVITPVAAHFWNRDLNNPFSLVTHRHKLSSSSSYITPCIAFQESSNAALVIGLHRWIRAFYCPSKALVSRTPYAPAPLSWAFFVFLDHLHPHRMSSPLYILPHDVFRIVVSAPMPPSSVPIVFPHLCSFLITVVWNLPRPFLPLPSFLLPSFWCRYLLFHSLPPIDSHLDHRFNFDPHTCGLLHLGLANFLLGPFPFTFPNGSRSLAVLLYVGTVPPPPPTSHNMVYISAC